MAENTRRKSSPKPLPRRKERDENIAKKLGEEDDKSASKHLQSIHPECPVCLQPSIHPVKLPCSHVFCFLCVKGAANQNRRCALCRQAIPLSFFDNPSLLKEVETLDSRATTDTKTERYAWFYEGREGWWQYDERTSHELEDGYLSKKRSFELLIAGYMYIIDLDSMVQMRRSDPSRRRRIKQDLITAPKKGIAGLKIFKDSPEAEEVESLEDIEEAAKDESEEVSGAQLVSPSTVQSNFGNDSEIPSSMNTTTSPDLSDDGLATELQSLSLSHGQECVSHDQESAEVEHQLGTSPDESSDSGEVLEI